MVLGEYLHLFKKEPSIRFSFTDQSNISQTIEMNEEETHVSGTNNNSNNNNDKDPSSSGSGSGGNPYASLYLGSINFIREYDSSTECKVFEIQEHKSSNKSNKSNNAMIADTYGGGERVYVFEAQTSEEMHSWVYSIENIRNELMHQQQQINQVRT